MFIFSYRFMESPVQPNPCRFIVAPLRLRAPQPSSDSDRQHMKTSREFMGTAINCHPTTLCTSFFHTFNGPYVADREPRFLQLPSIVQLADLIASRDSSRRRGWDWNVYQFHLTFCFHGTMKTKRWNTIKHKQNNFFKSLYFHAN